ncbi:TPA: GlxA family transcriptional regulator [Burkholderia cenocepacia]|uniref:GlxA family transcriptional regulator n=1 Tax=Burkholderia cepacia complex TaxID=87882 RepID=UPI00098F5618|nr:MULTISPECIES: GlxA family transcriptional regulator [Burkholderia cepacia complex]AQT53746.1 AraC family transcriptional regulator [Burkholderia cenocepacia]HEM7902970.1 GlxA family transcriptional regulator [Burkholderia cenocepacia]
MKKRLTHPAITIDLIIYEGFKLLDAVGPMSVFSYANIHLAELGRPTGYDVRIVANKVAPIASDSVASLTPTKSLSPLSVPHTAFVVGTRSIDDAVAQNPEIVEWFGSVAGRLQRTAGLCSGVFFLAAAGLLDGHRATTHWSVRDELKDRYPNVSIDEECIFLNDDWLWTSAGVTSGIDLALAMVEQDHGRELAHLVARDLVVYLKRSGTQSQLSVHLRVQQTTRIEIRQLQEWLLENITRKLSVAEMAGYISMSERNFLRVFHEEMGMPPGRYLEKTRIDLASQLLRETSLPAKAIASHVGFGSYELMRRSFQKVLGISPSTYRSVENETKRKKAVCDSAQVPPADHREA